MQKAVLVTFAIICFVIGIDKFFEFLPLCSLTSTLTREGMMIIGVLEILGGIGLLTQKYKAFSLRLLGLIMISAIVLHKLIDTSDFGGALFGLFTVFFLLYLEKKEGKQDKELPVKN